MKRYLVLATAAALVLAQAAFALAQEEGEPPEAVTVDLPVDAIDTSRYPAVTFTVTLPVELTDDTFTLADFFVSEGGEPRSVVVQQVERDELAVVFALDTSGSMQGAPLVAAKEAVASFVDAMPEGVAFAVQRFGSGSELVVPFTTDAAEVKSAVDSLAAAGETALYDGLVGASAVFEGLPGNVRRSLILLSDGGDTASETTLEQSIVGLLESRAEFVAVELESPENDAEALQRLQVSTQGTIVPASEPAALQAIFDELASDLLNQFRVTFAAQGGGLTDVTVAVRGENVTAVATSSVRFPDAPVATTPPTTLAPTPTTTLPPVLAIPEGETVTLPWYRGGSALAWGAVALFVGLFGVLALVRPQQVSGGVTTLRSLGERVPKRGGGGVLSGMADRASLFAEEALQKSGSAGGLRLLLDQAGLNLRGGEFAVIVVAGILVGVFFGNVFIGWIGAILGAVAIVVLAFVVVSTMASVRSRRFQGQLPDTLQLIAGALRAGFGVNQAIDSVVAEASEPSATEFNRVRLEVQLGRDMEDALATMSERVRSDDLRLAAEAIEIQRQVGGDLSELLERVAATIRERETVRRQIQVLSAEGRLSAIVLVALPIFIAVVVRTIAPDYLSELTSTGVGQIMIAGGVALMIIGILWIRRIVKLEY